MFRYRSVAIVLAVLFSVDSRAEVFFNDAFQQPGGMPSGWTPFGEGSASVTTEGLRLSNLSIQSSEFWDTTDVSIRTQLRVGGTGDAGLFGRVTSADHQWYFVQLGQSGFLTLGDGAGTPQISEFAMLDPVSNDVILHFDLLGENISVTAWEVGHPQTAHRISFVDDSYASGPFGIWADGEVRVRWFQAVSESADCNGDGVLNSLDLNCTAPNMLEINLTALGLMQGDADGNGRVDFVDFQRLAANFGTSGHYTDGDFDKSGDIDFSDFLVLASKFSSTAEAAVPVPEPTSLHVAILSVFALTCIQRRCRYKNQEQQLI